MVDEQTERKLKCLPYCNNRSEYKSHEFVLYVQQCNNKMDYMAPYSSEQTGIATSRKRSLPYSYNCTPVWWMDSMPRLYSWSCTSLTWHQVHPSTTRFYRRFRRVEKARDLRIRSYQWMLMRVTEYLLLIDLDYIHCLYLDWSTETN